MPEGVTQSGVAGPATTPVVLLPGVILIIALRSGQVCDYCPRLKLGETESLRNWLQPETRRLLDTRPPSSCSDLRVGEDKGRKLAGRGHSSRRARWAGEEAGRPSNPAVRSRDFSEAGHHVGRAGRRSSLWLRQACLGLGSPRCPCPLAPSDVSVPPAVGGVRTQFPAALAGKGRGTGEWPPAPALLRLPGKRPGWGTLVGQGGSSGAWGWSRPLPAPASSPEATSSTPSKFLWNSGTTGH